MSAELSAGITGKRRVSGNREVRSGSLVRPVRPAEKSQAQKGNLAFLQFGGVSVVYVVVLLCTELGVGNATAWLAFTSSFTACVVAGIVVHELKS